MLWVWLNHGTAERGKDVRKRRRGRREEKREQKRANKRQRREQMAGAAIS